MLPRRGHEFHALCPRRTIRQSYLQRNGEPALGLREVGFAIYYPTETELACGEIVLIRNGLCGMCLFTWILLPANRFFLYSLIGNTVHLSWNLRAPFAHAG